MKVSRANQFIQWRFHRACNLPAPGEIPTVPSFSIPKSRHRQLRYDEDKLEIGDLQVDDESFSPAAEVDQEVSKTGYVLKNKTNRTTKNSDKPE